MLPNLIVIGAMRAGTSSLHAYLGAHPEIEMSRPKELDFFVAEANWRRGVAWYESHFRGGTAVRGESSPNYTKLHLFPGVPGRLRAVVPDARLIYVVRDPVDRMASHYVHAVAARRESRPFEDALARLEGNRYFHTSRYGTQLRAFLECFPRERLLVLKQEDLLLRRAETLRRVFAFVGVDPSFSSQVFEVRRNAETVLLPRLVGRLYPRTARRRRPGKRLARALFGRRIARPTVDPALDRRLRDALAEDMEEFRALAGPEFAGWPPRGP